MPVSGSSSTFSNSGAISINANTLTSSDPVAIPEGATNATIYIKSMSGASTTNRIALEVSPNGTDWFTTGISVLGKGPSTIFAGVAAQARLRVLTVEGSAAMVDGFILFA